MNRKKVPSAHFKVKLVHFDVFEQMGNPFKETSQDLLILDTRYCWAERYCNSERNRTDWYVASQCLPEEAPCGANQTDYGSSQAEQIASL